MPFALKGSISSDVSAPGVRRDIWLGVLAAMVLLLGTLQHLAAPNLMHWVYVLQRLYYIPIVLAGLILGWRGGLIIALLAGAAYTMGTPIWTLSRVDVLDELLEVCIFCLVGVLCGALTDRLRKQATILRRTSDQLRQAHEELEKNFERIKRADGSIHSHNCLLVWLTRFGLRWQAWREPPPLCSARISPMSGVVNFSRSSRKRATN